MENQTTNEVDVQTEETVTTQTAENQSAKSNTQSYKIFIGVAALIVLVVGGMWYMSKNPSAPTPVSVSQVAPDTVLATVNGEDITQADIDKRLKDAGQALAAQGIDVSDPAVRAQIQPQVIDDLINYTLFKQNAKEQGVTADPAQLDSTFQAVVTKAGGEEQLATQLTQADLTIESFKQQLEEQLLIDAYLSQNIDFTTVDVTDTDVKDYYTQAVAQLGDTAPALEEVKDQIVQQLTNQKKQELVTAFAQTLRENAKVDLAS